jgi:hypothetical protein
MGNEKTKPSNEQGDAHNMRHDMPHNMPHKRVTP